MPTEIQGIVNCEASTCPISCVRVIDSAQDRGTRYTLTIKVTRESVGVLRWRDPNFCKLQHKHNGAMCLRTRHSGNFYLFGKHKRSWDATNLIATGKLLQQADCENMMSPASWTNMDREDSICRASLDDLATPLCFGVCASSKLS